MGIFGFIRNQLIDVISWLDKSPNTLVWRFPDEDRAIKRGAKLTVREGQVAIFVSEGQMADVFPPGLYTLTSQNIPVLTSLKSWKYGFESPFKAEVYFVNTRQYIDMKWGTMNPITLRDPDFGIVRVRAYGIYAIQVKDAAVFFKEIVGTDGHYTTDKIEGQLRRMLVSNFTNTLGQLRVPVLDLAGNYERIAELCTREMDPEFGKYGLSLKKFVIENISLPAEVEKAIDTRASMGAVGNLGAFTQYQAAQALRDAAQSGGGAGGAMGMGAGIALGQALVQNLQQPPVPPPLPSPQYHLSGPAGRQGPVDLETAVRVIRAAGEAQVLVWTSGMANWLPWQQVPGLASHVGPSALDQPPPLEGPPPLEPMYHYSAGGPPEGPLALSEVVRRIRQNPGATHKVWTQGMAGWVEASSVREIANLL